jgi:hemolysin activation/secretion protein
VYATDISDEADFCTVEFVWMNPTMWNDQNRFLTTLKNQVYHKNSSVFYQLLVGSTTGSGFETLK